MILPATTGSGALHLLGEIDARRARAARRQLDAVGYHSRNDGLRLLVDRTPWAALSFIDGETPAQNVTDDR
jgi:hypothetical protein